MNKKIVTLLLITSLSSFTMQANCRYGCCKPEKIYRASPEFKKFVRNSAFIMLPGMPFSKFASTLHKMGPLDFSKELGHQHEVAVQDIYLSYITGHSMRVVLEGTTLSMIQKGSRKNPALFIAAFELFNWGMRVYQSRKS